MFTWPCSICKVLSHWLSPWRSVEGSSGNLFLVANKMLNYIDKKKLNYINGLYFCADKAVIVVSPVMDSSAKLRIELGKLYGET